MKLVLASQSPRRREILATAGFGAVVRATGVPEERRSGESPRDYVLRLAVAKAQAVDRGPGEVVLAADTVVVLDGQVLEKPSSTDDARQMLEALSGKKHTVVTGICLRHAGGVINAAEETTVQFAQVSADEIAAYIDSGEPMDKAGGYAIQGLASKFITRIEGDYFNVVGLPVALVYRLLKGIAPSGKLP